MELKDYIKAGIDRKNGVKELGEFLGIAPNSITDGKAHRRGLPNFACVKLAALIGADPMDVIRASELATEKKAERREFWLSFANPAKTARVAGLILFVTVVTNFVTPSPTEASAAQGTPKNQFVLCKARKIFYEIRVFFESMWFLCKYASKRSRAAAG